MLEEDEERVQDAPSFANVVSAAICSKRIELVEQVHRTLLSRSVEYDAKLAGGLAEELAEAPTPLNAQHHRGTMRHGER